MALSSRQPSMNIIVWEPVIAAEYAVPWEILRKLSDRQDRSNFCSPFSVRAKEDDPQSELFSINFHFRGGQIEGILRQSGSRELLVKYSVSWTTPNQEKEDNYVTLNIPPDNRLQKMTLSRYFVSTQALSITLKLKVYGAGKTTTGASVGLNLARQSGSPFCDVLLRVDDHDFPAHKAVLSAASSVFSAMFSGDFKEKYAATVIIEGVSKVSFGKFLDFLYTEDVTASWEGSELELLELSERYQVERLKARCEMCLWELDGRRALGILMEAEKWPVVTDAMKERLCALVMANWRTVSDSDEWHTLQFLHPALARLVKAGASGTAAVAPVATVASSVKVFSELPPL